MWKIILVFSFPIIILEQDNHRISKVSIFLSTFTKEFQSEIVKKSQPLQKSYGGSVSKEFACNMRDPGSIPGSGRSLGEGNGNPLKYSCLENPMYRGAWWATVHGFVKSQLKRLNTNKQHKESVERKSEWSGEKVDLCLETNSKDSA